MGCMTVLEETSGPSRLHPALEHVWHPIARSTELVDGGWAQVRLLGRTWTVRRTGGVLDADPPAGAVEERGGLVWLAPAPPHDAPLPTPAAADPRSRVVWLQPVRCAGPAGPVVAALHRLAPAVSAPRTAVELQLPLPVSAPGATGTLRIAVQAEDDDSTRVHACLVLAGGAALPDDAVAAEAGAARSLLTDHLTWLAGVAAPGTAAPDTAAPPSGA
jgi:hypothetical protein